MLSVDGDSNLRCLDAGHQACHRDSACEDSIFSWLAQEPHRGVD